MPSHVRYYVLNDEHKPVEATLDEWCRWRGMHDPLRKTVINANAQVTTNWGGIIDDVSMPGPPLFFHIVEGPGIKENVVHTDGYDAALARHERIAEWLRARANRHYSSQ